LAPYSKKIDITNEYPRDLMLKLGEQGLLGMNIPEDYGGSKLDSIGIIIAMEELARVSGSIALITGVQGGLAAFPIVGFGTEDQKRSICLILLKENL
jgi:alkylation response protein AidB-like acyl-CoA dehydrogenase